MPTVHRCRERNTVSRSPPTPLHASSTLQQQCARPNVGTTFGQLRESNCLGGGRGCSTAVSVSPFSGKSLYPRGDRVMSFSEACCHDNAMLRRICSAARPEDDSSSFISPHPSGNARALVVLGRKPQCRQNISRLRLSQRVRHRAWMARPPGKLILWVRASTTFVHSEREKRP